MMFRTCLFLIALVLTAESSANAADSLSSGTKEERQACAPEVVKFCNHELDVNASDTGAILKCLQRNRQKIGSPCRVVLNSHGE
jgi:hypothetical protein